MKVDRFSPEIDYSDCYYEGDTPSVSMEEDSVGDWVMYEDFKSLLEKYLALKSTCNESL